MIDPKTIMQIVRKEYDVHNDKFYTSRERKYVLPRQICQYFIKKHCRNKINGKPITFKETGNFFGKDHSTVVNSCSVIDNLKFKNDKFVNKLKILNDLIIQKNSNTYLNYLKSEKKRIQDEIYHVESNNLEVEYELISNCELPTHAKRR